jgi:alkaline phosphatase
MKKIIYLWAVVVMALVMGGCSCFESKDGKAKYIFLFIGDGMSASGVDLTESWLSYKAGKVGGENLTMSTFPVYGHCTTFSHDRHATCSAAAGTAIATGVKTTKNRIATDPDGNELESISYVLQREGYNVALMSSSPVNHATEASFFAKEETRNNFYEITKTIPETGFQFFGGSGFIQFYGKDGQQESSAEYLERNGYEVCCGAEEFEAAAPDCDKIVLYQECFRDTSATDYVMDGRKPAGEIELPQMMKYALDFIGDEKPFFVMCEQGTIDWAAHLNRVLPMVNAVIEFDDAIKVAYEFYLQHPDETLIVVTSDHGTGGPAIGAGGWGRDMVFWDKIEQSWNDLGQCNDLDDASNMALNESATIGWTTIYHTGECVPVYAIGKGAERFGGKIDNTEIKGKLLAL